MQTLGGTLCQVPLEDVVGLDRHKQLLFFREIVVNTVKYCEILGICGAMDGNRDIEEVLKNIGSSPVLCLESFVFLRAPSTSPTRCIT